MARKTLLIGIILVAFFLFASEKTEAASLNKGLVTFTVDDNESSVYSTMYPVLKSYGMPATAYVVTDWMGTKNHLKWSQLKTIQNKGGWEIGNHTKSHKDLTLLSSKDLKNQIKKADSKFTKNGIKRPRTFAAPYGEFNISVLNMLKSLRYTSNRWAWSEFGQFNEKDSFDPFNITVVSLKSPLNFDDAKKLIDEAASEKKWLVFVVHGLVSGSPGDYEFSASDFQKTADYLNQVRAQGNIEVKTISQGSKSMNY